MVYCQIPEQIWMYILRNTAPAKAFLGIDRLYAHKEFTESVTADACGTCLLEFDYLTFSPASSQASPKKSHSSVCCPTLRSSLAFWVSNALIFRLSPASVSKALLEFRRSSSFQLLITDGATPYFLANTCSGSFY